MKTDDGQNATLIACAASDEDHHILPWHYCSADNNTLFSKLFFAISAGFLTVGYLLLSYENEEKQRKK